MTRAEWDEWMPRQMAGYAEHIIASGQMSEADAWAKAKADTARGFYSGYTTPGQQVFRLMAGDEAAGWLWLAVPGPDPDRLMGWVYNIEVDPAFRGRGFGRAAMLLAEKEARSRGMTSLGLNVHGLFALILMGATLGLTAYLVFPSVARMTTQRMSTLLMAYVVVGCLTSAVTTSDA